IGPFRWMLPRSPYDTASPAVSTWPSAVVTQYPAPAGVAARSIAGLATGAGAVTALAAAKLSTVPSAWTAQPPVPPVARPSPTSGEPTVMLLAGPEIVKVTAVPSGAACPSAPV